MEKGNCDRKGNAKEWTIIVLRKWVGGIQTNGKRMRENWTGSIRQPNAGSRKVSKWGLENVGKSESWTGKCWESGTGKVNTHQWLCQFCEKVCLTALSQPKRSTCQTHTGHDGTQHRNISTIPAWCHDGIDASMWCTVFMQPTQAADDILHYGWSLGPVCRSRPKAASILCGGASLHRGSS